MAAEDDDNFKDDVRALHLSTQHAIHSREKTQTVRHAPLREKDLITQSDTQVPVTQATVTLSVVPAVISVSQVTLPVSPETFSECTVKGEQDAASRGSEDGLVLKPKRKEEDFEKEENGVADEGRMKAAKSLKTYSGVKPYTTQSQEYLKQHEPFYRCNKCPYAALKPGCLGVYLRIHSGEKPLECDQCPYDCRSLHGLNRHKQTYSKEKPFKCVRCSYAAEQSYELKKHSRTCEHSSTLAPALETLQYTHSNAGRQESVIGYMKAEVFEDTTEADSVAVKLEVKMEREDDVILT